MAAPARKKTPAPEPHLSKLGRDPPGYDWLAPLIVRRCFREAGLHPTRNKAIAQVLERDIQHELQAAFAAGAESVRLEHATAALDEPACRVCGCTDSAPCPGGCAWVPDPEMLGELCTSCLPDEAEDCPRPRRRARRSGARHG